MQKRVESPGRTPLALECPSSVTTVPSLARGVKEAISAVRTGEHEPPDQPLYLDCKISESSHPRERRRILQTEQRLGEIGSDMGGREPVAIHKISGSGQSAQTKLSFRLRSFSPPRCFYELLHILIQSLLLLAHHDPLKFHPNPRWYL
jgi:hypothetical protein